MRVTDSADLAAAIEKELEGHAADALSVATSTLLDAAVRLSSGPFSQSQLDEMDNPYAKRHGSPLLDPGKINAQTGQFRASWQSVRLGRLNARVINTNWKGQFLVTPDGEGTRFMFHRGVDESAQDETQKRLPWVSRS